MCEWQGLAGWIYNFFLAKTPYRYLCPQHSLVLFFLLIANANATLFLIRDGKGNRLWFELVRARGIFVKLWRTWRGFFVLNFFSFLLSYYVFWDSCCHCWGVVVYCRKVVSHLVFFYVSIVELRDCFQMFRYKGQLIIDFH